MCTMPLATLLIGLHVFQPTMTSRNSSSSSISSSASSSSSRGGHRRTTMLRIPGPSSPVENTDAGKVGVERFREGAEGLGLRGDAHPGDLPAVPCPDQDPERKASVSQDVFGDSTDRSGRGVVGNSSSLEGTGGVSASDLQQDESSSSAPHPCQPTGETRKQQTGHSSQETEIVSVLKRRDSPRDRRRTSSSSSRTVSVSEPFEALTDSTLLREDSKTSSVSSTFSDSLEDYSSSATTASQIPAVPKRRISFPADSVLTAVIQDGDTAELLRILTGRHGPGLVQRRGEGGVTRGVDVCQSNHVGLTALHHAVLANNLDAAKLLLCHGADVNAQDVHGFSPLHTAAACGFVPLTSLLLLFGADVFAQTLEQELPIDVAKELKIVRLLTGEMTRLVHQELWVASLLRLRAEEAWLLLRKLLACVLLFVLHVCICVRTSWRKRHRKAD